MEFTAKQIAEIINGEIEGNADVKVSKLSKIEEGEKGSLSFLANPKYTKYIYSTLASIVIVDKTFKPEDHFDATLIKVEDAYTAFAKLLEVYNNIQLDKSGISDLAYIDPTATIGNDVYIGPFAYIGERARIGNNTKIYPNTYIGDNVSIGEESTLFPGVKIYSNNIIGDRCTFHAGVVIGSDGFGFAEQVDNNFKKVAQIGNVIVEDEVEMGANCTIDRATLGSTIIRKGVKFDNQVHIAHNVEIGENTVIAGQVGVSGSSKVGRNCMIGGQAGIVGHINITDNVKIGAQSGISSSIKKEGEILLGSPAFELSRYRKSYIHFRNLSKIIDRIDELEKKLNDLK